MGKGQAGEALKVYEQGLAAEPGNVACQKGIAAVPDAAEAPGGPDPRPANPTPASARSHAKENIAELLPPFQLLPVPGLAAGVQKAPYLKSLAELVVGPIETAIVSNYMMDVDLLFRAFPALKNVKRDVVLLHGETEPRSDLHGSRGFKVSVFKPETEHYGTHHTKMFLLFYSSGVRVIVHTANLLTGDLYRKVQGVWHQDFPLKASEHWASSDFEAGLARYVRGLKLPRTLKRTDGSSTQIDLVAMVRRFDFSTARAKLITSVPGRQRGLKKTPERHLNGHMAVRRALEGEDFSEAASAALWLVMQPTSLGSMKNPKVYKAIVQSFCAGLNCEAWPRIVWPTAREVLDSTEGKDAGKSIPATKANVDLLRTAIPFHRFRGATTPAKAAMPHIKTYARYDAASRRVAWCMVGSHNLSGAAWGVLEKDDSQLYIRSFELSVLMLPSLELQYLKGGRTFDAPSGRWRRTSPALPSGVERVQFRHLGAARAGDGGGSTEPKTHIVALPLPYPLPDARNVYRPEEGAWHLQLL